MGVCVAQALAEAGHQPCWVSQGRSPMTRRRAGAFQEFKSLPELLNDVQALISVCPPDAALKMAQSVMLLGYRGIYVDANAIAPATALQIAALVGGGFVDGGIIGPPARRADTTRLYLCGPEAEQVASWFEGSLLAVICLPERETQVAASALKMAYAAYTKGTAALLLSVNALAQALDVEHALAAEWAQSQPNLASLSQQVATGTGPKAWRFEGEMYEIAQTYADADLPPQFHQAAAEVFSRMATLKERSAPDLASVIQQLLAAR